MKEEIRYCNKCGVRIEVQKIRLKSFDDITGEQDTKFVVKCQYKKHWWDRHTEFSWDTISSHW